MKAIFKNKYVRLGIVLLAGGIIGWLIKPSINQTNNESDHSHIESSKDQIWTCSMHPQIRLSEPGKCPICGMDLIPVNSTRSVANVNPMIHEMTPEAVAMANIHTSRVAGVSPDGEVFLTGKVQYDERQFASVTAKFPGRIERLNVNFTGQVVRAGESLATIYSPELVTAQKELLEAVSSRATYPELYAAVREKLRLWKLTEAQIDEIEKTGSVRDQFDLLADKSGVVTQRNITVGDYVNTGSILFEVVDLSKVWIMLDAYETDLSFVKVGDEVSFTAAGIPGKTFTARVTYIDPIINARTRTASVRAEAINHSGELKPEMFINARIRTSIQKGQSLLAIPRTALLWSGKRSIVYVKVPDSEFPAYEMREITIGSRMGEMYMVEAGLKVGEEIVTNGVFAIDAASQLSGKPSMLNPKGGPAMTGHDHGVSAATSGQSDDQTMDMTKRLENVRPEFKAQLTNVYKTYLKMKDAFVASDAQKVSEEAKKVTLAIKGVEMGLLKGDAHMVWMEQLDLLEQSINSIAKSSDIEEQRTAFSKFNLIFYKSIKIFGLSNTTAYYQYCPMANRDHGAYWFSETEEIRNPYFGDMMLGCGENRETLK